MIRINAYNLLYDLRDFVRQNRIKLIVLLAVNVLAIIIGVRSGFAVGDAETYLFDHRPTGFLFIAGKKGVFGFFFTNLLVYLVFLLLITFSAAHFLLAYCGFILLFLRSYMFALHLSLYIIYLKLTVLPYLLFCMIPFYLLINGLFCVLVVWAINQGRDAHLYGCSFKTGCVLFLRRMIMPCIMLGILALFEAFIGYFLTLGIIL